ncbi:hypothetical protein FHG87_011801 [Trinorchestia longiramus]|nr:hypothetical protein FHG87_011801 [Trinorchestia longiramus]
MDVVHEQCGENKWNARSITLTLTIIMFLTSLLLKPKSKRILVIVKSLVSGHKLVRVRERNAEKIEMIAFDPFIGQDAVYKELKKLQSIN